MASDRYGIFSWYGIESPIRRRLAAIRGAGFRWTSLWWGDDLAFAELDKPSLVNAARDAGLQIENVHVPYEEANHIWSESQKVRSTQVNRVKAWIDDCAEFSVPILVMHLFKGDQGPDTLTTAIDCIHSLVQHAERNNVQIALENTRNNVLLEAVLDAIPSSTLGLCYDTSHAVLHGDAKFDLLRRQSQRILCFHISDNDGIHDRHWNIGEGVANWNQFASAFPAQYRGVLTVEVVPRYKLADESAFLAQALGTIKMIDDAILLSGHESSPPPRPSDQS